MTLCIFTLEYDEAHCLIILFAKKTFIILGGVKMFKKTIPFGHMYDEECQNSALELLKKMTAYGLKPKMSIVKVDGEAWYCIEAKVTESEKYMLNELTKESG